MRKDRTERTMAGGFTLIELLVVIAIIGVLSTIVTVSLGSAKAKTRDSKRIADLKSIQVALELYYNDNQMYPWNIYRQGGTVPPDMGLAPNYLPVVPTDPGLSVDPVAVCGATPIANGCYSYNALKVGTVAGACNGSSGTNPYPSRYHLGAVLEDTSNTQLTQDIDAAPNANGFVFCSNSPGTGDFNGTSVGDTTSKRCTATAGTKQPGGTETCYDQTP